MNTNKNRTVRTKRMIARDFAAALKEAKRRLAEALACGDVGRENTRVTRAET
jgi:hypothetical protein